MTPAINNTARKLQESRGLRARAPVAAQFEDCFQAFVQLYDSLQANSCNFDSTPSLPPENGADEIPLHERAEYCRRTFSAWGNDSGASSRALDHALKESPSLMQQTLYLLGELSTTLERTKARVLQIENDRILSGRVVADDQDAETSTEAYLDEIQDILTCLLELLPVLRYPMVEETGQELLQIYDPALYPERMYRDVARTMFPHAPDYLWNRLAQNNIRARKRLGKLRCRSKGLMTHADHKQQTNSLMLSRAEYPLYPRGTFRSPYSFSSSSNFAATESDGELTVKGPHAYYENSGASDMDASSMTSTMESQPHVLQQQILNHRLPDNPSRHGDYGKAECPLCHFDLPMADISGDLNDKEWAAHAYLDLRPYVCTSDQCALDNIPFGDKDMWFQHEMDFHRSKMEWSCVYCSVAFRDEKEFEDHLLSAHGGHAALNNTSLLIDSCKRYSAILASVHICDICLGQYNNINSLKNCLAGHLETFARATTLGIDQIGAEQNDYVKRFIAEQRKIHESSDLGIDNALFNSSLSADDNESKVALFVKNQQHNAAMLRCNVPNRDHQFFGRHDSLSSAHLTLSTLNRMCTITGRPGIGKTAAAIEYSYKYESAYSYTFWVEAENEGRRAETYGMIAASLKLDKNAIPDENSRTYIIRDALTNTDKEWLLIFDNATSWNDIARYIPPNLAATKGSVLITTRDDNALSIPVRFHHKSVSLDALPLEDACRCLLSALRPGLGGEMLEYHPNYQLATKVVEVVKRLPLAITIVVGYVNMSRCTLDEFLEMWEENDSRMRKKREAPKLFDETVEVYGTIDALWEIGIREVDRNSRRLLDIMSFLDSEGTPKTLLIGDHKEEFLEFLHESETISFKRMIKQLSGRRLIHVKRSGDDEPSYGIHRLLQKQIHLDMNDYSFADSFRKAFHLLRKRFPRADPAQIPRPATWVICEQYMRHVSSFHRTFMKNSHRTTIDKLKTLELAELFYDAGFYVWSRQTTGYNGLDFLASAEAILNDNNFEADEMLRANIHCMTGLLLLNIGVMGRRKGTERLQEARRIRRIIFKKDPTRQKDVMYRNATNDYALCLLNKHQFDEAGRLFRACFERYQVWGSEKDNPFEYSKYYGNYSVILMWQGKTQEAIDSMKRCMEYTEKFSGRKAQYYRRQFMLACLLLQHGDEQGALDMHLTTLKARLELHGKLHEFTMDSTYAVGHTCIECAKNSKWPEEALGRAKLNLAELYEKEGIGGANQIQALRVEAKVVSDKYSQYTARQTGTNDE
ncbi:nb-arc and tpr domain containing protein [Grosmannia clavigera kw1407]|uniref:Nb-arc and tpr domain containing protein n=1 Tax=Grosmannia clavigera (strain kw1407 / UAMH 11150) TaxID=655863 RepID=F0XKE3_GROCL|nr:nb-arc and tpr domain containing protein [Grosmannia clavigera kw1407]EFX01952.1 nb-arc and tpr domain containing protein [Grosmannia clavigera kw1407]